MNEPLAHGPEPTQRAGPLETSKPHLSTAAAGFGVWTFRGDRWDLVADHSGEGYTPGSPPGVRGLYEGQTVRKEAAKTWEPEPAL